jgi:hypothetical protein
VNSTSWIDVSRGVEAIVQSLAIVVGGVWAYFKFIRGHTFRQRGEFQITASLVTCGCETALKVVATFRNTGLSKIVLSEDKGSVYVFRVTKDEWPQLANISWGQHLKLARIFEEDEEVDAQESIADQVLLPLTTERDRLHLPVAYRVAGTVAARRSRVWFSQGPFEWTAHVVLPAESADSAEPVVMKGEDSGTA